MSILGVLTCILSCFLYFSPVYVVIRQKTSSPRLLIPRSIAQEMRCYVCMPIRALYLYAEPIVEPLFLYLYSSCAILQIHVSSALLTINVVYGVFAGKASPSQHYNHTPELSRSPGPASLQHPARWMDPDQYQKEKQSFIMRVIVGDVPNSGYMLRFTQEHACLRISTKPVDMPHGIVPRRHSTPSK